MNFDDIISFFEKTSSIENIALGIAGSLILIGFQQAYKFIRDKIGLLAANLSKGFSLNGNWLSITYHDSERTNAKHIDIIEVKHQSSDIKVIIWHYGSMYMTKKWYKYYGQGVQKGQNVSIYYYLASKVYPETGCAVFHLEGAKLVGPFIQYTVKDNDSSLLISDKDYCLRRVNLPFKQRMKMLIGKPPFKDFNETIYFSQQPNIYND